MKRILFALSLLPLPALADTPAAPRPELPQSSGPQSSGPQSSGPQSAVPSLGAPLSATEFEAYAIGKTLTYAESGQVWGQEEYLPDHQVVWAFTGQPCEYGTWSEAKGPDNQPQICFSYVDNPDQNCWQFYRGSGGLVALFMGSTVASLSEVDQTNQPMQCPGPKVGV